MIYLLDANSFIEAKNRHYRMNVVPGFWEWLTTQQQNISLQSIIPVFDELTISKGNPDDLALWAIKNKSLFISTTNQEIQQEFASIANYLVTHPTYSQQEVTRFLSGADPWLIATAKISGAQIVTHEVPVPKNSKKVKIPNIAREFEVECLDVFDLLGLSGYQLALAK